MNITENDVRRVVTSIRADFDNGIAKYPDEPNFDFFKQKARYQMQGVLNLVTPFKISSYVLVCLNHLKAVEYQGGENGNI